MNTLPEAIVAAEEIADVLYVGFFQGGRVKGLGDEDGCFDTKDLALFLSKKLHAHFAPLVEERDRLTKENSILRGIAAKVMPCHYCGVDSIAKCPYLIAGDQLQAILTRIHEALGESEHSDDETLPEVVAQICETLKEARRK